MGVVLNKSSQEPPFRKSFASFRGPIRVAFSKIKNFVSGIKYMESNKLEYQLYNKSVVVCTNEWKQPKCHCDMLLLFPWTNIRHGYMQPILGRTWLEWIRLSRIFRAPFANLSLEIVKKKSRYYLLSGLSRIFRKPFANVYISRKVPFAQASQIYACGPRLYKTFHGFLHDSHISSQGIYPPEI